MLEYECYSFSRLFLNSNLEFFFILGVNNSDNFDELWDGRNIEVIGYTVIYIDSETNEQKNFIYLIDYDNKKYDDAIKYTKKFIEQMSLSDKLSDTENFKIINTEVYSRVVSEPYKDFIKAVVKNEIPEFILDL
ncbi:hypothetical protein Q8G28_17595 [Lysinibacillus capsici]|uniref:hypothetical protein n=1 Tax=Lysinibacillus capsici TaxID=2115968 RepID=UPI002730622F|nr:hypothetical protein [Lysinibacillus capsici]MDP1395297.1 hypothetical protein [Lysinibacillus capsici]MDP1415762.1 hypothetical protein [Lysinibacillus capsici]MDP1431558.1 hypothetical protein [Lysinibacillus capsici]